MVSTLPLENVICKWKGPAVLKLKRVDIHGFKSFYDRTDMKFHGSGIAAVVGPNGCGKSNISDAISWVLGEQSAKSLRGTRMEDVIFAGTRERKPLGMAQVTLTMVDPRGRIWSRAGTKRSYAMGTATELPMATRRHAPSGRHHDHPAAVSVRRKRIPDQRQDALACATSRICSAAPAWVPKATPSSSRAASARFFPTSPPTAARSSKKRPESANIRRASAWPKRSSKARSRISRASSTFWKRSDGR